MMLRGKDIEVTVHPSDVAVAGSKEAVARARAAVADRLTKTDAYLTSTKEAQEVEDAIRTIRTTGSPQAGLGAMKELDERLSRLVIAYEEWEVLYRQRLQTERDLLRAIGGAPQRSVADEENGGSGGRRGLVGRVLRGIGDRIG
jgi:hypothetical protein